MTETTIATGNKRGNWKGGRVVASNSYILIRVGIEHHLADVRGYAYEHRLVAEKKIGRRLRDGEQVHHIDNNTQNNAPENLQVCSGITEHRVLHRHVKRDEPLRTPGQDNPTMLCRCGCGKELKKYDRVNRPRTFIAGHNSHSSPTKDAIVAVLKDGPLSRHAIAVRMQKPVRFVASVLSVLKRRCTVYQVARGIWALHERM